MKNLLWLGIWFSLALFSGGATPLEKQIEVESFIITKAELRRHLNGTDDDRFRPATRSELYEHLSGNKIYYLVVRILPKQPGMFSGVLEVLIDGKKQSKLEVSAYGNGEWAEYFIPRQGWNYAMEQKPGDPVTSPKEGPPEVKARWLTLSAQ